MSTDTMSRARPGNGVFWAALGAILLGLVAFAWHLDRSNDTVRLDAEGIPYIVAGKRAAYQEALDGFHHVIDSALGGTARGEIEAVIDSRVGAAFAPVHARVPAYLDFHYSVMGEYTEIGAALTGDFDKAMRERLLDEPALRAALAEAGAAVEGTFTTAVAGAMTTIEAAATSNLPLSQADLSLLGKGGVVALSVNDALARFDGVQTTTRLGGALAGGALAVQGVRVLSRQLVKKLGQRVVMRASGKLAGIGGGASTGATVGSVVGPVGTVLGGLIGGVAGWVGTDAVLIKLDEVLNRDEFAADLRAMIDAQEQGVKTEMLARYTAALDTIAANQKTDFEAPLKRFSLP